ncbi:hypothetical protein H0H93_007608 [Arthromyces matolae]|nr:hypothetical protein H0H93_007608 [Arthromyces matolae]
MTKSRRTKSLLRGQHKGPRRTKASTTTHQVEIKIEEGKVRLAPNLTLLGPHPNAADVVDQHGSPSYAAVRTRKTIENGADEDDFGEESSPAISDDMNAVQLKRRILVLESVLEEKGQELESAISFMNVAEPLSGADIIRLAGIFNDELFQASAYIAEELGRIRRRRRSTRKGVSSAHIDPSAIEYMQAIMSLGPSLMEDLVNERKEGLDSGIFVLQVALQICMVTFGANVLQSWSSDKIEDKVIDQLYTHILSQATQGVAGSWRAVTRRTLAQLDKYRNQRKAQIEALLYTIVDILKVAGCVQQEREASTFISAYYGRVGRVVDSALELRDAIMTVTHMDVTGRIVPPESIFCAEVMANCHENKEEAGGNKLNTVLGTTGLGLDQRVSRLEGSSTTASTGILLKPMVVLRES